MCTFISNFEVIKCSNAVPIQTKSQFAPDDDTQKVLTTLVGTPDYAFDQTIFAF